MILFFCVRILLSCVCVTTLCSMHHRDDDIQKALMVWHMHNIRHIEFPLSQYPEYSPDRCFDILKKECHIHYLSFYDSVAHAFYIKRSYNFVNDKGKILYEYIQPNFDCCHIKTQEVTLEHVRYIDSFIEQDSEGEWYGKAYICNSTHSSAQYTMIQEIKKCLPAHNRGFHNVFFSDDFLYMASIELGDKTDRIVIFFPYPTHFLGGRIQQLVNCCFNFE